MSQDGGKTFAHLAGIDPHGRLHTTAAHGDRLLVATDKGLLVSSDHGQCFQPLAQISTLNGLRRITHAALAP